MSKAAICVVVPVYKAMATLDRCVESVLAQQVEGGLTCILVDDGSPDESGALCDAWAAKDDRVTVIHQDDLGVSGARNSGLAAADSEFIVFLDSDDALRPGALQAALTAQRAAPQDFVVWHYTTDAKDPAAVTTDAEPRPQAGLARLWLDCLLAMPWNKLYRADLAKQLQFDVQYTLGEDLQFVLDYIALLGRTVPEFGYRVMTSPLRRDALDAVPRQLLRYLAETLCQAERRLPCRRLPGRGHAPLTPRRIAGVCRGRGRHHAARSLPHPAAERLQGRGRAAQSLAAGAAGADEDRALLQRLLPALPLA